MSQKNKILIFIVAYNAESTIENVLMRIPSDLQDEYEIEVLIIDDQSSDNTVLRCIKTIKDKEIKFTTHIFVNPENQGYGGNQKIGYQFAVERNFDCVALLHGDGQYAPECLKDLVKPVLNGEADAVFGSRMLTHFGAVKGGMPLYKYAGNKILTFIQNVILKTSLSEFHSGYRVYSVKALKQIPFHLNTPDFHFDTEIIIQLLFYGFRIAERPIPTYYGDEICYVNGMRYALDVTIATIKARMQSLGLFYDRKYDIAQRHNGSEHYEAKLDIDSPSRRTLKSIPTGAKVLEFGCGSGALLKELSNNFCHVCGVDQFSPNDENKITFPFYRCNLNYDPFPVMPGDYDFILMHDVLEHLAQPECFLDKIYSACHFSPDSRVIASTGNIAFFPIRALLLLGQFNYGKRGILDLTHTRLFTFKTFKRVFEQAGFDVIRMEGIPAPVKLALGDNYLSGWLTTVNRWLISLSRSLFSYQIYLVAKPKRSLKLLLKDAKEKGHEYFSNNGVDRAFLSISQDTCLSKNSDSSIISTREAIS
ncbi:glycosyltransferase [Chlorobaculum sp. 24CR]|uniref:bifunctional glycosyltransferase/class I SAM-dependent methyltransferase n=1 Tax=Chlorobaculum sp. 24CR TaxID=2508878 RepID=UPI00100B4D1C|nr:bifunctional glycosyltransferase/class I SAM-dependent methyltransferase [Chlorobaculum sp. 24CR]RXK80030.1 glycosyltransferase [Chlorobaculum sp. 24CR]